MKTKKKMNEYNNYDEEPYGDVGAGYTAAPGRVSEIWPIRIINHCYRDCAKSKYGPCWYHKNGFDHRLAKVIAWFKRKKIK